MPLGGIEIEAWCIYCNQRFLENIRFRQHLESIKTPWYLYSGLSIVVLFFILLITERVDGKNDIETYFNAPQIGDVYLIENPIGQDTIYYFFRLADIYSTRDSISCYYSKKYIYSEKPLTLSVDDYFIADEKIVIREYLDRLHETNRILSIWRGKEVPVSCQKIKPKETIHSSRLYISPDISTEVWQTLLSLRLTVYFDETVDDVIFKPNFNEAIKKLDGEVLTIKAFIDLKNSSDETIWLSAYQPVYSCILPDLQGIIGIPRTPKMNFDECTSCVVRGELDINEDKPLELPYRLKNIEFMYCDESKKGTKF